MGQYGAFDTRRTLRRLFRGLWIIPCNGCDDVKGRDGDHA